MSRPSLTSARPRDALRAQERALALASPSDYTDRSLTRLDRAMCLAHDGDVADGMAEAIDTLTSLTVGQRKGIIDQRGQALLAALPPPQRATHAARELRDLLETEEGT